MLAATGLSAFALTETSAGLSIANAAKKASATKAPRVVLEFLIYLLLLATKKHKKHIIINAEVESTAFAQKVGIHALLCATSVCSVPLWFIIAQKKITTEAQSTQRLHREEAE